MKVVIPLFGKWVSPRFGFSPEMLLLTIEDGKIISQKRFSTAGFPLSWWLAQFSTLKVDTVICGGIDGFCCRQLERLGIYLISDVAGDATDVIDLFLKGKLRSGWKACRGRGKRFRMGKGGFCGPPLMFNGDEEKEE